jgi:hypothetical protein
MIIGGKNAEKRAKMLEMSPSHAYVCCDYTQNVLKSKCLEW